MTQYLIPLQRARRPLLRPNACCAGNKARGLWFLQRNGFAVPRTLVCTWAAYRRWVQDGRGVLDDLRDELARALSERDARSRQ